VALARVRYSDLKEAALFCGGRGCYGNSIGGTGGSTRHRGCAMEDNQESRVKKSCCKVKCDAVRRTLGSEEEGLVGQEDTKRGSERRHARGSRCRSTFHAATASLVGGERSWSSAAVSLSMTSIGPPHLGQSQASLELAVDTSALACVAEPSN
jgi:hypothetical protein